MQHSHFSKSYLVRFSHCDPAGIVYFPQYLVITNWLIEDWFTEGLDIDFNVLINQRKHGLPIVKLECEFLQPSRQGDSLLMNLQVEKIGRSSLTLIIEGSVGGELRMRSRQVLVYTCLISSKSVEIPDHIRTALSASSEGGPS
ncbi:acyl-CoA thioesterase [Lonsdalea quercina]|uniref:acyl-CoA thioesterase n=1 Tax=Lonsdalea quercina TaxID=71657 RepID=UPI003975859C